MKSHKSSKRVLWLLCLIGYPMRGHRVATRFKTQFDYEDVVLDMTIVS